MLPTALNAADEPLAIVINLNEGAVALGALIAGSIVTSRRMDAFTRAQYEWGDVRSMTLRRAGWPSDLTPPCKSVDIGETWS